MAERKKKPRAGRKLPPPETTGAEAGFLAQKREAEEPVTVQLVDGRRVTGVIRYYDRDMVKIEGEETPGLFIRKDHIRTITEIDPE